jgi:hypothetical protein
MHAYRCVQLLIGLQNEFMVYYFNTVISTVFLIIAVLSNFTFIRFQRYMTWETAGLICYISACVTGYLVLIYNMLGGMNQHSSKLLKAWQRKALGLKGPDRVLMSKYLRACRPLRFASGPFGYFRRPAAIQIVGKLIVLTVKFTILMNKVLGGPISSTFSFEPVTELNYWAEFD